MADIVPVSGTVSIKAVTEVASLKVLARRVKCTVIAPTHWPVELDGPRYAFDDATDPLRYVIFSNDIGSRAPWLIIIGGVEPNDHLLLKSPEAERGTLSRTVVIADTTVVVQARGLSPDTFEEVIVNLEVAQNSP